MPIPFQHVGDVLPMVMSRIESIAAEHPASMSADGIVALLRSGDWQLWLIDDGARDHGVMLTEVHIQLSGRKACMVRALTGSGLRAWMHLVRDLEAWARDQGCRVVEMLARPGYARVFGEYRTTHVLIEKEI